MYVHAVLLMTKGMWPPAIQTTSSSIICANFCANLSNSKTAGSTDLLPDFLNTVTGQLPVDR